MNADASAGVALDARIGATLPALTGLAWGLIGGGLLLLGAAVLLLVIALRRPRTPAGPRYAGAPGPYGAPPYWTPPAPVDRRTAADAHEATPTDTTPGGPRTG